MPIRSEEAKTASRSGWRRRMPAIARRPPTTVKSPPATSPFRTGRPAAAERVGVALHAVLGRRHVERAGDRRDLPPPQREQELGRCSAAAAVVGVDPDQLLPGPGPAQEHRRDPGRHDRPGQRVGSVEREQDDAVDVACAEVALDLRVLALALRQEQEELEFGLGQRDGGAVDDGVEERVREDAALRLRDDERDRVGAPRDERAGGPVWGVRQRGHGLLDGVAGPARDARGAVDRAGRGRPRDAGELRHLVEGGAEGRGTFGGQGGSPRLGGM